MECCSGIPLRTDPGWPTNRCQACWLDQRLLQRLLQRLPLLVQRQTLLVQCRRPVGLRLPLADPRLVVQRPVGLRLPLVVLRLADLCPAEPGPVSLLVAA